MLHGRTSTALQVCSFPTGLSTSQDGSCPGCTVVSTGAIEMSTRETIGLWWTVVKASFAYQVLVCIGPLMTGQMVPLANAKQANSVRRYRIDSMSHQQLVYT